MNFFREGLTLIYLAAAIALSATPAVASNLCAPPNPPLTEADDDWRARENQFGTKNFTAAMRYFDQDLPRALHEKAKTEDVRESEVFVISISKLHYHHQGYVLRQDALLRMVERDLTVEKSQRGRASKGDVAATTARFEETKRRFCEFLKTAKFND